MRLPLISLLLIASLAPMVQASSQADLTKALQENASVAFEEISQQMAIQINLSGKQRMLTQKMSKESLLIVKGIDAEKNKENLKASMELFEKTLVGLKEGDESLELAKTTESEILEQLDKVSELWEGFKPNIESIIAGETNAEVLTKIAEQNLPLLAEMNKAVGLYEIYSGADLADSARVINLSGKQRMLTQKMTKELLLIANDINPDENKQNLTNTTALFEKTLTGLAKDDEELGLEETTDADILKQLDIVKGKWDEYKPVVESESITDETLTQAAEINLPLLAEMNKAVKMYEVASSK